MTEEDVVVLDKQLQKEMKEGYMEFLSTVEDFEPQDNESLFDILTE